MRNAYSYIDPDYTYTDPQTGVMRNKENINDAKILTDYESFKSAERMEELQLKPIKIKNSDALFTIHKHLFALEHGWTLNLNPADNVDVYERYMSGTIDGDVEKLAVLILELLKEVGNE
ncbi:MAG: hypothetical protein Ta2B_14220 [Termitinemataceae bacterium]|nr:MAG: hypothetical protein Ta2B_14220 [Termitinemataceae bacterium]